MAEHLTRHTIVSVGVEDWRALVTARPDLAGEPLVAEWADAGHPLVARRRAAGDEPGSIALGLPLPPAHGKRRIAISLPPGAIAKVAPPPLLQATARVVPADWRPAIAALIKLDPGVRVFGSLAWEHLTGLAYLTPASDLDLLWDLPEPDDVEPLLSGIAEIAQGASMRIDGEIRARGGDANWSELKAGGEVLVKAGDGVCLMPRNTFLVQGQP